MRDRHNDMTPYYNYLIDGGFGLNILVFSGDDDDVCATIGTQVQSHAIACLLGSMSPILT